MPGRRWPRPASPTSVVPVTYMNSSADIKAFCGRNGGVVCTSSNAEVALEWAFDQKPGREGALPPRPAPRPQHRGAEDGPHPRRLRRLGPAPPERRPHHRAAARREDDPLEGPLLGARPLLRGGRRRAARDHPRRADPGAPRVQARGRAQGRPGRLDGVHHQDHRGGAGRLELGDRHRAQPGQAARGRPPGQADHLPRQDRLLLLDDEPDRPPALRVGAGVAGRRHRSSTGSRSTRRPRSTPWSPSSGCSPCRARPTRTDLGTRRSTRAMAGWVRARAPPDGQPAAEVLLHRELAGRACRAAGSRAGCRAAAAPGLGANG